MKKPINFLSISWGTRQTVTLGALFCVVIIAGLIWPEDIMTIIIAALALTVALFALEWAQKTVRPFLSLRTVNVISQSNKIILQYEIFNSGAMPASEVHTCIDFFGKDEEVTEDNQSGKYQAPSREVTSFLLFPNKAYNERCDLDLNKADDNQLWDNIKGKEVKHRVCIMYSSFGRHHLTIQTEQIMSENVRGRTRLSGIPVTPQKWT